MYKSMWDNINRHILVVWQSVAAVITALAALYLSGKEILNPEFGTIVVLLVAAWSIAHAIDASGWFNRNLLIITNIEREFLFETDANDIHYFFCNHRPSRPIEHLTIQILLAVSIAMLGLAFHFVTRVIPAAQESASALRLNLALPYGLAILLAFLLIRFSRDVDSKYAQLQTRSPGKAPKAGAVADGLPRAGR